MTTLREAAQAALDALKAVYGSACQGEIGVLDVAATCGGGVYTLWDRIKAAAASLDAALAQPEHPRRTVDEMRSITALEDAAGGVIAAGALAQPEPCFCGDRPKAQCPGEWEQGCDLGSNPKYARAVPVQPKPKRPDVDAVMARARDYRYAEGRLVQYAYDDLRAAVEALAQPEPTAEPVAWQAEGGGSSFITDAAKRQNPATFGHFYTIPLYAAPQRRKPLTEEQCRDMVKDAGLDWQRGYLLDDPANRYDDLIRAVERKHEIGDDK